MNENNIEVLGVNGEVLENDLIIKFKNPYNFEGKEYTQVDLTELENINCGTLMRVNERFRKYYPGVQVLQEMTLEYAVLVAVELTNLPIEFFKGLDSRTAMKIKNRVTNHFFGEE